MSPFLPWKNIVAKTGHFLCVTEVLEKENHLKLLTFPVDGSLVRSRVRNCITVGAVKQAGTCVNSLRELPAYNSHFPESRSKLSVKWSVHCNIFYKGLEKVLSTRGS